MDDVLGFDEEEDGEGYGDDDAKEDAMRDMMAAMKKGNASAAVEAFRTMYDLCAGGASAETDSDDKSDTYE